ncbi:M48 family metallopeptidase [Glaesserella parasuis]|uniref:M48 family metallopeptidase n=1 Tax=Glaesserella parasuis TaxID=738 RepID=UPI0013654186|nr:SprT family zinc-dependent metalloprotease [Glaesserella parasuis]MWQ39864.1 M48 family metallopeptidase [Glaesserella parasuis]
MDKFDSVIIPYGDQHFTVRLVKNAKYKRLRLTVQPTGDIIAYAPPQAIRNELIFAISKQSQWIADQLQFFQQNPPLVERQYISSESHRYLGRKYLLKVYETPNNPNQVRLWRGQLEVSVREKTTQQVQQCLDNWYRQKAKQIFAERLNWLLPQTFWVTTNPHIRLRTMKTRWGSCSVQGSLCLNPHLIKAPKECIDYVILHELCHFAEHNHSERFYHLMGQMMPQWKEVKTRLDRVV